ncbi:hypothetical protein KA119_01960 [Candidatus Gracilibacteria bacterium]|nr:hypothetical protein [Candidatus Gracilibacteria bacterium]
MKALQKFALSLGLMAVALVLFPSIVEASSLLNPGDVPESVSAATGGEGSLRTLILRVVNYGLGFLGVIAVIMIIYAGVLYTTAAGNDDNIGKAKNIIMYAVVGILIVLLSFVIVQATLGAGTGVEV